MSSADPRVQTGVPETILSSCSYIAFSVPKS
nr:MAG TPA: hypothetical protein [Caudoviricetes sp.]